MKRIPAANTKTEKIYCILVSDVDFKRVSKFAWHVNERCGNSVWTEIDGKIIYMSHFLKGKPPEGFEWDHKDRNKLNNVRRNLRLATPWQNQENTKRRDGCSGFKGVYPSRRGRGWWKVKIRLPRKQGRVLVGRFNDVIEAARAYDKAVLKHHGRFAVTNFPVKR